MHQAPFFSVLYDFRIKRAATDGTEGESKRQRLDDDIAEETVARILEVINDPKKMLGPEVDINFSFIS